MKIRDMVSNEYRRTLFALAALVLVGALYSIAVGAQDESSKPASTGIEPTADELLHKMSNRIASAEQFTVEGERTLNPTLSEKDADKGTAKFEITVQRPSGLMAKAKGDGVARTLFYDGKQATLLDELNNVYASVAATGTNEEMLDSLNEDYGFSPPLVDFIVQNPYEDLTRNVLSGREQGLETINGDECNHLVFQQEKGNWEIWIAKSDMLPRKFVINGPKQDPPQLTVVFSKWDLSPKMDAGSFSFVAPQGADKIDMIPVKPEDGAATDATPAKPESK